MGVVAKRKRPARGEAKNMRFAREYVIDHNGAQAAIRAGYAANSAKVTASRLLTKNNVRALVDKLDEQAASELGLKVKAVVREVARISLFNVKRLYDHEGRLTPIHELPDDVAAAIGSLKFDPDGQLREIKPWDKNSGLEKAMKHLGLFEKDNEQARPLVIPNITFQPVRPAGHKGRR